MSAACKEDEGSRFHLSTESLCAHTLRGLGPRGYVPLVYRGSLLLTGSRVAFNYPNYPWKVRIGDNDLLYLLLTALGRGESNALGFPSAT